MAEISVALLKKQRAMPRSMSHAHDELEAFRTLLKCLCVDQSSAWTACLSWSVFVALTIVVPVLSHFALACTDCHKRRSRPYEAVAQISLSAVAALSFVGLSRFISEYGLRRFLFFDKLCDDSDTVRNGYTKQFNISLKFLFMYVLPCFAAESVYKIWWYASGGTCIPLLGNLILSNTVACALELCSWFYRTMVFFLVCVFFRLICYLQILRLQEFAKVFEVESEVEPILREHLRIRRHLRITSHRYRVFILWSLIFITASLFASLLMTTRIDADVNIFHTGELAVCSVSLLAGLMIVLRSATKITHKALGVLCLAAKWHVCATVEFFDTAEPETPAASIGRIRDAAEEHPVEVSSSKGSESDSDDVGDEEDELDNTKLIPSHVYTTISYQKRQALLTYFESNRAGITLYGFMLDRSSLDLIFGIELSLVLWLLGKTIGSS